jgi:phosphoglycolate phosphatase
MKVLKVGFDLDMTLVNSSAGICAAMTETLPKFDIHGVSTEAMHNTIGVPLRDAFLQLGVPEEKADAVVDNYRANFDRIALPVMTLLPFARETLEACRSHGAEIVVVSSRKQESLDTIVEYLKIKNMFTHVRGGLFGEQKGDFLKAQQTQVYVGDHEGDVRGAKRGGCVSVAVATGPSSKESLLAEGADVLFDDLSPFPAWLSDWVAENLQ